VKLRAASAPAATTFSTDPPGATQPCHARDRRAVVAEGCCWLLPVTIAITRNELAADVNLLTF
jgi:hypothetical protein